MPTWVKTQSGSSKQSPSRIPPTEYTRRPERAPPAAPPRISSGIRAAEGRRGESASYEEGVSGGGGVEGTWARPAAEANRVRQSSQRARSISAVYFSQERPLATSHRDSYAEPKYDELDSPAQIVEALKEVAPTSAVVAHLHHSVTHASSGAIPLRWYSTSDADCVELEHLWGADLRLSSPWDSNED
jgi:hypothetical protein